ncbi:hypothetical protein SUGI_0207100 [Cryptomeria japonica]|nr:hypothetical protein SUGI_0207100 [Cryptomeria japonica]
MRNFKYVNTIKSALEEVCPGVVSCADIVALSARDGVVMLGGPRVELKTGRRDSKKSSAAVVDKYRDNIHLNIDTAKLRDGTKSFQSLHVSCKSSTQEPAFTETGGVNHHEFSGSDQIDNNFYKNLMKNKSLLVVDQQLLLDPRTSPYGEKMAQDNQYFFSQFSRALTILSENNPLTGNNGEIRKDCRFGNV